MIRVWISVALLSVSWLFTTGYYHLPGIPAGWILIGCATALLGGLPVFHMGKVPAILLGVCTLPAVFFIERSYMGVPLLMVIGALLFLLARDKSSYVHKTASALVFGASILCIQGPALSFYSHSTARMHQMPKFILGMAEKIALCIGADHALSNGEVSLFSMRTVHQISGGWEILVDPATVLFAFGSAGVLAILYMGRFWKKATLTAFFRHLGMVAAAILIWVPLRWGFHSALLLHRGLITDYDAELILMNQFWSRPLGFLLLLPPVFLLWRFRVFPPLNRESEQPGSDRSIADRRFILAALLICTGFFMLTLSLFLDPVGKRTQGRVLVDEYHSEWERTDKPFDTTAYYDNANYHFTCIYNYLSHYYTTGRITVPLTDSVLSHCDVLMLKIPTSDYDPSEIDAVERFVRAGGGVILIGEHTNVFNSGTYLNRIGKRFGLTFRNDCLLGIDKPFDQVYTPPIIPHPVLQYMPPMDFAVSCGVDTHRPGAKAVMTAPGLRSVQADYHISNYYPAVKDYTRVHFGAFNQLVVKRIGRGRILLFTDSTIYSNFAAFEPGKAELMVGMIEWLNHSDSMGFINRLGLIFALLLLGAGLFLFCTRYMRYWYLIIGLMLFGWSAGVPAIRLYHQKVMPFPQRHTPYVSVGIDRGLCRTSLSKSGFIPTEEKGFGIFEQWILRVGYFLTRTEGEDLFDHDMALFLYPEITPTPDFKKRLIQYVESGGKVVMIESALNDSSTADHLLRPFGLTIDRTTELEGTLKTTGWPAVSVESAVKVQGGTPVAHIKGKPVCAYVKQGRGIVMAVGFGHRFSDVNMGVSANTIPDEKMRAVYTLEFRLLKSVVENLPPVRVE